jgi:hypothetical protein
MVYLLVSIFSAFAIGISVYAETSSFLLAFAAYSLTGTLVLSSVLVSAFFDIRAEDKAADA